MTGKQPDQASAQRGYCPEPLLTPQFLCLASTFARYRSVDTHHHWISTQIRLNWSNQKGGYDCLPPSAGVVPNFPSSRFLSSYFPDVSCEQASQSERFSRVRRGGEQSL